MESCIILKIDLIRLITTKKNRNIFCFINSIYKAHMIISQLAIEPKIGFTIFIQLESVEIALALHAGLNIENPDFGYIPSPNFSMWYLNSYCFNTLYQILFHFITSVAYVSFICTVQPFFKLIYSVICDFG